MTLTAQLPDEGRLRAASYSLRSAGDTLASQASVTQGVVNALGPGVWQDSTSGRAKDILGTLCAELSTGSSAMYQAADALDSLASYVASQQWRYEETGRQIEEFARDPIGDLSAHHVAEAGQIIEERRSIEQNVSQAMGHASEIISGAAARASRYHGTGGRSFWSSLEHDLHDVSDFVSGIWDGTYDIGKGLAKTLWSLEVLSLKLSPERLLFDPHGFFHDAEHAANTLISTVDYLAHNKQQFVSNLLNLDELRKNPIHWAGELVPSIVLTLVSFGVGGAIGKGGEASEAIDVTVEAASGTSGEVTVSAKSINHVTDGYFSGKKPVGFHSAPGGIAPEGRSIDEVLSVNRNGTYRARVSFQKTDGTWEPKRVPIHTMFPNSWGKADVISALKYGLNNHYILPDDAWGWVYKGVAIKGYVRDGEMITAFPAPEQPLALGLDGKLRAAAGVSLFAAGGGQAYDGFPNSSSGQSN